MHFSRFDEALLTGNETIDSQHRSLFALADRVAQTLGGCWIEDEHRTAIADACEYRVEDAVADAVFGLVDYITEHFEDEQALMASAGYPAASVHAALHTELSMRVASYTTRYLNESELAAGELIDFFGEWLCSHIMTHDRAFTDWLSRAQIA